jgi:hypothetical protein
MTLTSDLDKGTTLGDADGPYEFVPCLGQEVPTFVDPRHDLISDERIRKMPKLRWHVPFKMRGIYKPEWLPEQFVAQYGPSIRTDLDGYVLCNGMARKSGKRCVARAIHRSGFCSTHGGALHPADKKMSGETAVIESRVERLDRCQKVMQGLLPVEDLTEDEIMGGYVEREDGVRVPAFKLGKRWQTELANELNVRVQRFLQSKLPTMVKVVTDIAEGDFVEPKDRLTAAFWAAERVIGKTPEVLVHREGKPYESVFEALEVTKREDFRRSNVIDAESDDIDSEYDNIEDAEITDESVDESAVNETTDSATDSQLRHFGEYAEPRDETDRILRERIRKLTTRTVDPIAEAKATKERIKKARNRRFAARASGASTLSETPVLIEFKPRRDGKFTACLFWPDEITEAKWAKIEASQGSNQGRGD